ITVEFSSADFIVMHHFELTFSYISSLSDNQITIPVLSIWLTEKVRQQALCSIVGLNPFVSPWLGVYICSRID
ncbi:ADP-heptose--LPS heptosyltransferase, partial [Erwinia amylovora]|nr:ADP-heptose--LPS heptosyltransferase [Erwinia amylovora]